MLSAAERGSSEKSASKDRSSTPLCTCLCWGIVIAATGFHTLKLPPYVSKLIQNIAECLGFRISILPLCAVVENVLLFSTALYVPQGRVEDVYDVGGQLLSGVWFCWAWLPAFYVRTNCTNAVPNFPLRRRRHSSYTVVDHAGNVDKYVWPLGTVCQ